jgi:hypothetical protein
LFTSTQKAELDPYLPGIVWAASREPWANGSPSTSSGAVERLC